MDLHGQPIKPWYSLSLYLPTVGIYSISVRTSSELKFINLLSSPQIIHHIRAHLREIPQDQHCSIPCSHTTKMQASIAPRDTIPQYVHITIKATPKMHPLSTQSQTYTSPLRRRSAPPLPVAGGGPNLKPRERERGGAEVGAEPAA